jgi:hypothetical protein
MLSQAYVQWKHRFTEKLTLNSGLSLLHYQLSNQAVLEPRLGATYVLNDRSSLSAAYGLHSNLQPVLLSFYQLYNPDGSLQPHQPRPGLHPQPPLCAGLRADLAENLHLKAEAYYQSIFDAPVERCPATTRCSPKGPTLRPPTGATW